MWSQEVRLKYFREQVEVESQEQLIWALEALAPIHCLQSRCRSWQGPVPQVKALSPGLPLRLPLLRLTVAHRLVTASADLE